jgi:hypothetical protein
MVSRAALCLWLLFLVDAVGLPIALGLTGVSDSETIQRPVHRFLDGYQQTDSWRPMKAAEDYLDAPHDRPVYEEMLENRGIKFQYPLSSLIFTRHLSLDWLNWISWISIIVVLCAVWKILRRTGAGTPLEFRADDPAVGLALVGLTLTFYPLVEAYSIGQIQAWINALLALAILSWTRSREDLAGVAVGLACLLKPSYGLLGVWGAIRRRWQFVVPVAGVLILGALAAYVAYGWVDNVDYFNALRVMGRQGEAYHFNQSFNGVMNRLLQNGDSMTFDRSAFAPFHPVVYATTLAAFGALATLAVWLPVRGGAAGTVEDFSVMLLTITITAPIAWTHHYGILLPILAATAPRLLVRRPFGAWTAAVLIAAYLFSSELIAWLDKLTWFGGLAQSYLLLASLTILAMLYRSLRPTSGAPLPAQRG